MAENSSSISYSVNGCTFEGFLADGSNGRKVPGILVAHEGHGFNQHPRDRALMLAELGYVAYAPDFFGGGDSSPGQGLALVQPYFDDRGRYKEFGNATLDILRNHPNVDPSRLGAIGFCWGGYAVIEMACTLDIACAVAFHPGLSLGPFSNPAGISGKILMCVGDQDPYASMSDITTFIAHMKQGKVDCQIQLMLGAPHGFANPASRAYTTPNMGYDALADRRSWSAMRELFAEAL